MRSLLGIALLSIITLARATPLVKGYPAEKGPVYSVGFSKAPFAKTSGHLFDIDGKGPTYMAGTNGWWLSHILSNDEVDGVFKIIAETKLKVVRVWGFGSVNTDPGPDTVFFQLLNASGSYINYAENGMPRLDYVVHSAEKHGLKLVLPFVNYWSDLGGMASYNTAFGGNLTTWYTDKVSQKVYKDWIKLVVNRYKKSPAIFAWELGNEPRCAGCPTSVITTWATEISKYIKSLDSKHMVTLGDEGYFANTPGVGDGSWVYTGGDGVDWIRNLQIKTLDYGTTHLYPDWWGYNYTWGSTWIKQHDVGKKYGKPSVLEEYGGPLTLHNHTWVMKPWQDTVLKETSLAMDQFWQFGYPSLERMGDVFSIYSNDSEYQILAVKHAKEMLAKPAKR